MEIMKGEYTSEQLAHLDSINRRLRELEEKVFRETLNVKRHIQSALDSGMKEYQDYYIKGELRICFDDETVPGDVADKFLNLEAYEVLSFADGKDIDESRFNERRENTRKYDFQYWMNQEQFPDDYFPESRAFNYMIRRNLYDNLFSVEDLMFIAPDYFVTHIEIHL